MQCQLIIKDILVGRCLTLVLCNPCKLMLDNIVLQCQQSFLFLDHVGNPHNPWHMDVWEFLHDYLLDYMLLAEIMGITNMIQANLLDDM